MLKQRIKIELLYEALLKTSAYLQNHSCEEDEEKDRADGLLWCQVLRWVWDL